MSDTIEHQSCRALGDLITLIGNKWTVQIVGVLADGPRRFNEIRNTVGVSQRMLTQTLRKMELEGLVTRTVFATVPPRVDYELTESGHTLIKPLRALTEWALIHQSGRRESELMGR